MQIRALAHDTNIQLMNQVIPEDDEPAIPSTTTTTTSTAKAQPAASEHEHPQTEPASNASTEQSPSTDSNANQLANGDASVALGLSLQSSTSSTQALASQQKMHVQTQPLPVLSTRSPLDLQSVLPILARFFGYQIVPIRIASLQWILELLGKIPRRVGLFFLVF